MHGQGPFMPLQLLEEKVAGLGLEQFSELQPQLLSLGIMQQGIECPASSPLVGLALPEPPHRGDHQARA